VLASPAGTVESFGEVAGSVVTKSSVAYYMNHLFEIKTWSDKDDDGMYPRPLTYEVKARFMCIFYLEVQRDED
jgi:hypothetical protein